MIQPIMPSVLDYRSTEITSQETDSRASTPFAICSNGTEKTEELTSTNQSTHPYDVDTDYADAGFASYKVGDNVSTHEAWGVGVYSFFKDHTVDMESGIKAPSNEGVKFHNSLSVLLNGSGSIKHIINEIDNVNAVLQQRIESASAGELQKSFGNARL